MRLEEEIKQSKFSSPWAKVVVNLIYTGNWVADKTRQVLKPYGLNDQHYNILRILRGKHPLCASPGEIKEVLLNKRGDLTRLLDKLVNLGLVARHVNLENRRKMDLSITEKGLALLEDLAPQLTTIDELKETLDEKEAQFLNELLDKMRG